MKKRILGLVMAAVMALSIAVPVAATDVTPAVIPTIEITLPGTDIVATLTNVYNIGVRTVWNGEAFGAYEFFFAEGGRVSFDNDLINLHAWGPDYDELVEAGRDWTPGEDLWTGGGWMILLDVRQNQNDTAQSGFIFARYTDTLWCWVIEGETSNTDFDLAWVLRDFSVYGGSRKAVLLADLAVSAQPGQAALDLSSASDWAREGITRAIELGLVPQNLQSNFTQPTTRAEFAALAVALYENQRGEITGRRQFDDTDDVNVQKAAYIDAIRGMTETTFVPDNNLTREQAAVILSRLANAMEHPLSPWLRGLHPFSADMDVISSWAFENVLDVYQAGIMTGVGDMRFDPQGTFTREQSIITILRLFDIVD